MSERYDYLAQISTQQCLIKKERERENLKVFLFADLEKHIYIKASAAIAMR